MKKNIGIISYGSGGSEVFNALLPELEKTNNVDVFPLSNLAIQKLKGYKKIFTKNEVLERIKLNNYDFLLTETSNPDGYKDLNEIIRFGKSKGIAIISILDVHGSYARRFTEKVDCIITPTSYIDSKLKLEIGDVHTFIGGNPAFDNLKAIKSEKDKEMIRILYTSQPNKSKHHILLYQEISELIKVLMRKENLNNYKIFVKLHPKEHKNEWDGVDANFVDHDDSEDFTNKLINYNLIIGVGSTVMLKSYIMGIPTIFYDKDRISIDFNRFLRGQEIEAPIIFTGYKSNSAKRITDFLNNYK